MLLLKYVARMNSPAIVFTCAPQHGQQHGQHGQQPGHRLHLCTAAPVHGSTAARQQVGEPIADRKKTPIAQNARHLCLRAPFYMGYGVV